jgi:hypothetical protein
MTIGDAERGWFSGRTDASEASVQSAALGLAALAKSILIYVYMPISRGFCRIGEGIGRDSVGF